MHPRLSLYRVFPLIVAGLLAVGIWACTSGRSDVKRNSGIAEINDSLRRGNITDAVRLTNELKSQSLSRGDSSAWAEGIVQQCVNAYYQGKPELLLASTDTALQWLLRQEPTEKRAHLLAKTYQARGGYYDQFSFNSDSTLHYLKLSIDNESLSGDLHSLPQVYGNYANAMRMAGALDSAALYYHRAISVADSLELSSDNYLPLYNGIAAVFTDMRDFNNSAYWWAKSMETVESMNQFDKFNTLTGYGNDLYYRKDYAGANRVFTELRRMLDSVPESRWEKMFTDVNLADSYLHLGQIGRSIDMLDSTARFFSIEQPNPMVRSYIHTLQMRAAIKSGDMSWANYLVKMYPVADTLRLEQLLARLEVLEELYAKTGDYEKAYNMSKRYDHVNDSLRSYTLSQQISTLNALYQRDKRILTLESNNTKQQARIYRLLSLVTLTIAIIVGLSLFLVMRRVYARRREERMMAKIISLRQENLRNRVTPHFIYNALNHELSNSGDGKPTHPDALVRLIRKQQSVASEILIPFSEELAFVNDYIDLIGDNGRDKLVYRCDIAPGIEPTFLFPSMALQILVENAFKHGFTTLSPGEERLLEISAEEAGAGRIAVTVFNNCGKHTSVHHGSGTGLRVLVETIRLINERNKEGIDFSMRTDSEYKGRHGCVAVLTVPATLKS